METGAVNVSQNFGVSAYPGRMAVEVLTCVNNLQSRCDMLEDAGAILGCAACCSGLENTNDGMLLDNSLEKSYSYSNVLASAVSGQPFIGQVHNSQMDSSNPFPPSNVINQNISSDSHPKRQRKRAAGSPEDENSKKKGRASHLESCSQSTGTAFTVSAQQQGDKERLTKAKSRKGKDSFMRVKSEGEALLSNALEPKVRDEGTDAETAAREWQRCVSLLKRYGIIENPDLVNTETTHHCVPHPGYVGDGLLTKMCKMCGAIEDANNTVICDDCQEAFHLTCCVPRLTSKYFKREDNWFCGSCRKHRKKIVTKSAEKCSSQDDNVSKSTTHNESKARLGPAHQADVPEWQNRALDNDAERCIEGCIGMEIQYTEEEKVAERDHLLKSFIAKVESLGWLPAEKVPPGTVQNWVKCNNVVMRSHKDSDGRKQSEVVCGKWRRAPLNVEQTDEWECFCAMEWDPLHADCAIPQECSDEEVLNRLSYRMQMNTDGQASEAGSRKSTLRQGKFVQ